MKEYEYIVLATNEIFSHMITSIICLENYYNETIDDGFRKVFKYFNELRTDFKEHVNSSNNENQQMELAKCRFRCRCKREEMLESYILELKEIDDSIDYEGKVKEYFCRIEKEDVETLEMQLMIYPYLLSLVRKNEENKEVKNYGAKYNGEILQII